MFLDGGSHTDHHWRCSYSIVTIDVNFPANEPTATSTPWEDGWWVVDKEHFPIGLDFHT